MPRQIGLGGAGDNPLHVGPGPEFPRGEVVPQSGTTCLCLGLAKVGQQGGCGAHLRTFGPKVKKRLESRVMVSGELSFDGIESEVVKEVADLVDERQLWEDGMSGDFDFLRAGGSGAVVVEALVFSNGGDDQWEAVCEGEAMDPINDADSFIENVAERGLVHLEDIFELHERMVGGSKDFATAGR